MRTKKGVVGAIGFSVLLCLLPTLIFAHDCPECNTVDSFIVSEEKPVTKKIRFNGLISLGGEVELTWKECMGDCVTVIWERKPSEKAFHEWLDNLTIKELRGKWGVDIIHMQVVK